MDVRMYEHRAVMEAGRERTFSPGAVYDVPSVLGVQWVRAGVAAPVVSPAPARTPSAPKSGKKGRASA